MKRPATGHPTAGPATDLARPGGPGAGRVARAVHPIEAESYRILRALVDLSGLGPLALAVAERVIHASADVGWAGDLVLDEAALAGGLAALDAGAPVVVDARMVAAGITSRPVVCALDLAPARPAASGPVGGRTRSAAGTLAALERVGPGAVWVVGVAPTALEALLAARAEPALVVGLPVGFVGAVEAKQALAGSGLPAVTNRSVKGGAAVATAALNALLYHGQPGAAGEPGPGRAGGGADPDPGGGTGRDPGTGERP